MKVLVIEDNPIDSKLASALVQMGGHEFREERSAQGALEVLRSYRPDVILLDLNLPGTDGIQFAHEVRRDRELRNIPIVAITAYPLQFKLGDVLSAGCASYIVKPFDTRNLIHQLQAVTMSARRDGVP